jgi:LysR family transcriptional regulator, nitrogen assimilation regulatory protein
VKGMDLRQLRYFIKIVDYGNMTRAAEALNIAQPALSQQIANLESDLGIRLFNRSVHGVKPTRSGELLYRYARDILRQVANATEALQRESNRPGGRVSVAMPSSTARIVSNALLLEMRSRYPGITLELVENTSAELPAQVMHGRVDLAVVTVDMPIPGLLLQPIIREDLFVLMHPETRWTRRTMTLRELAKLPIILPSPPNNIRARIDLGFSKADLQYEVIAEASTTPLLISMVKSGLGVTVLPLSAISQEPSGSIRTSRITKPSLSRELSVCSSAAFPLSVASEKVREVLIERLQNLIVTKKWRGAKLVRAKSPEKAP